jgi:hypothetical protein
MTEYELVDAIASFNSGSGAWSVTYFTILSAYLIAAYMAGSQLTRSQVIIISGGFSIAASMCCFVAFSHALRSIEFANEVRLLNPNRDFAVRPWVAHTWGALLSLGILVALKFMWDVRHPKAE